MKKLLLASVLAIASFPGFAAEKVIPDDAWADTPECQALKRSRPSNVPIPDNCEVGMADVPAISPKKELQDWMAECTNWETGEGCPKRSLSKAAQALSDRCSEAGDEEAILKCIDAPPPRARVTVAPPYQGPPPIGWVWGPYTQCGDPPRCSMGVVNVAAAGLNVRTVPNGPAVMALVNGVPLIPVTRQGPWILVAAGCDLTPTFAWSWTAGVPLNRCWVYF
jgi:hypothetical protein